MQRRISALVVASLAIGAYLATTCSDSASAPPTDGTVPQFLTYGRVQLRDGRVDAAIASFRMALLRDRQNPIALSELAAIYQLQGRAAVADRYLRRAVHLTYTQGLDALAAGDTSGAAASFEHTIRMLPQHPLALVRLGSIARRKGKVGEAIDLYIQATKANPNYAESFLRLGDACAQAGRDREARTAYEQAIDININAFDAYIGLGQLLAASRDWDGAVSSFRKALLIRPDAPAVMEALEQAQRNL